MKIYNKPEIICASVILEGAFVATSNATVSFGDDVNPYTPQYESWDEKPETKNTFEF